MPPTDAQLHDMGLTPLDNNDEQPIFSDWPRKKVLHDAIIASDQPNKPKGDLLWATIKNASAGAATCNMCINVARITGVVTGGGSNNADKVLDDAFYICKKESADWIRKYLTFSKGESKTTQHLKLPSSYDTYSVMNYASFVPVQVRDASDKYINMYYTKHKNNNQKLTKSMINISFSSF